MINDAGLSQSWKERAMARELEQETEETANMGNREISVMWASSQGGCDPLNRLLRNVDSEHLSIALWALRDNRFFFSLTPPLTPRSP